ncbi:MAG: di-heme oxidoredictase family protein [Woeseiaceae bacterium]
MIRPFGRKGEFSSVREFDKGAMMFHLGMQPAEVFPWDADQDGIDNEILTGEMSALEIFVTTQETPVQIRNDREARAGFELFESIGCADCHVPALTTRETVLRYAFPEVEDDPDANVFYSVDLTEDPAAFRRNRSGGIVVPMFSDLKRHDMGDGLAESFAGATEQQNREFITAKLWGVADTAPYLHDGRALTLTEAILAHGGEAQSVKELYEGLSERDRQRILAFLGTLRNPESPNFDVLSRKLPRSSDQ